MSSKFSQEPSLASLQANSKVGIFNRLHYGTLFQKFPFSGPKNAVIVWTYSQKATIGYCFIAKTIGP